MTQDVRWPMASESVKVVGKEEIRAYWIRQWRECEEDEGRIRVRVRQLIKSVQGDILSDSEVLHVFTVNNGLIQAMDLGDEADPNSAFAHRRPGPRNTQKKRL